MQTIDEWGLRDSTKILCFDTIASNNGVKGGVCIRLEHEIGKRLLNLACCRHIGASKSPNIKIFSYFRIDQAAFSAAQEDRSTTAVIAPRKDSIVEFVVFQLNVFQPHDDYRELFELTIIFLGVIPHVKHISSIRELFIELAGWPGPFTSSKYGFS